MLCVHGRLRSIVHELSWRWHKLLSSLTDTVCIMLLSLREGGGAPGYTPVFLYFLKGLIVTNNKVIFGIFKGTLNYGFEWGRLRRLVIDKFENPRLKISRCAIRDRAPYKFEHLLYNMLIFFYNYKWLISVYSRAKSYNTSSTAAII